VTALRARSQSAAVGLQVRPRRVRRVAGAVAGLIVIGFTSVALLLTGNSTGVYFRPADQVAMVVFGLLLAGAVLLATRPRLRVGPHGVAVRNVLGEQVFPWTIVQAVSFPPGASWARLELPEDEYVAVLAIQAADGERAVTAMAQVRELHRTFTEQARPKGNQP